jgi:hypothetical protein
LPSASATSAGEIMEGYYSMLATDPAPGSSARKSTCPHCGKPYRTLIKRNYGIKIDGGIKQSVPLGSQWRCMACGKSYVTKDE